MDSETNRVVVTPRDAATVLLLRDTDGSRSVEVLMVRRHAASRFVPDAYVFPGGRVEEADCTIEMERLCCGLDHRSARRRMPDIQPPERALGTWVAGVRETFEEVGILLACNDRGEMLHLPRSDGARFRHYRRQLHGDRISLAEILRAEGLALAAAQLHYFAHWITPVASPIRYDVRFFAARAPAHQIPRHDGVELTEHRWVRPRDALAECAAGRFPMILPTRTMVAELARFPDVEAVLASARGKRIPAILSKMVRRNGRLVEVMPDEPEEEP